MSDMGTCPSVLLGLIIEIYIHTQCPSVEEPTRSLEIIREVQVIKLGNEIRTLLMINLHIYTIQSPGMFQEAN